jgi:predicted RNase H-like nuclease (RuvC/YqgF family)
VSENSRIDEQGASYKDASPATLLQQLNENWTKLRVFERTVADRDRQIDKLHASLRTRDKVIEGLKKRLTFGRTLTAIAYAIAAGVAGAGAKELGAFLFYLVHR